jgi:hypothetical protein
MEIELKDVEVKEEDSEELNIENILKIIEKIMELKTKMQAHNPPPNETKQRNNIKETEDIKINPSDTPIIDVPVTKPKIKINEEKLNSIYERELSNLKSNDMMKNLRVSDAIMFFEVNKKSFIEEIKKIILEVTEIE